MHATAEREGATWVGILLVATAAALGTWGLFWVASRLTLSGSAWDTYGYYLLSAPAVVIGLRLLASVRTRSRGLAVIAGWAAAQAYLFLTFASAVHGD